MKKLIYILLLLSLFTSTIFAQDAANASCPEVTIAGANGVSVKVNIKDFLYGSTGNLNSNNLNGDPNVTYQIDDGSSNGPHTVTREALLTQFQNNYQNITCPPKITDLQTLVMRMFIVIDSIVGLVIFYVLAKAAITRMLSRGNPDLVKKSMSMIIGAITGLGIVLTGYIVLIFIGQRLLPSNPCYRYSFTDSARVLFFFDQSDISPNAIEKNSTTCP